MRRRALLGIAAGATLGLAGCTARALPLPGSAADDDSCPAVLDVERMICPGSDGPIAVELTSDSVAGEDWSLAITVANRSVGPIGFNPYAWSVYRYDGGRWRKVAPDAHVEPWLELDPEARYTWLLTDGGSRLEEADQRVTLSLAAGRYAFAIPLRGDDRIGAVAPFTVDA